MLVFGTLTEAVAEASTACLSWKCLSDGNVYSLYDMTIIGQIVDNECPLADDSLYYVVFPNGEIGMLCTADKLVDRLYMPLSDKASLERAVRYDSQELEARRSELLEARKILEHSKENNAGAVKIRFCTNCGAKLLEGSNFCCECGSKVGG